MGLLESVLFATAAAPVQPDSALPYIHFVFLPPVLLFKITVVIFVS